MKVKELLTDESKWTKFTLARDRNGHFTYFNSKDAMCWCLAGAIEKCYPDMVKRKEVVEKITKEIDMISISVWNDCKRRKFAEVKAVVEKLDI